MMKQIVLALLIFTPHIANAIECDEMSPNFMLLGDQYFGPESTPVMSLEEKRDLESFLEDLYGNWDFQVEEIFCKGSGDGLKQVEMSGTGKAVFAETRLFPLKIGMDTEFKDVRKFGEIVELLALDAAFNFSVSDKQITAAQFRRTTTATGSMFHEFVYDIVKTEDEVNLQLDFYNSGVFYSRKNLRFTRN